MTQEWVDNHNKLSPILVADVVNKEIKRLEAKVSKAFKSLRKRQAKCDHKTPDGKSAWVSGFIFSECSVCGCSDY